MARKTTKLTLLQTRKQLLLVESELNRAQLAVEWREMKTGMEHLAAQVSRIGSMAESAVKIGMSCIQFFQGPSAHKKNEPAPETSWISSLFNAAKTGVSFLFRH